MLAFLADSFSINQPSIQLPFITNRWAVGFIFLVHIIFGSFTMGALVLGPTYESACGERIRASSGSRAPSATST